GSDTTANALANILFNLLNNPDALERLAKEVRSRFADVSQVRPGATLQECEYPSACIDEGLRLTPVVGGYLQRGLLAGGVSIGGQVVVEGTDVGVSHHAVMRNREYFDNP
ncbi:cytochrome P450, partial [Trematosphaeria pertusa]